MPVKNLLLECRGLRGRSRCPVEIDHVPMVAGVGRPYRVPLGVFRVTLPTDPVLSAQFDTQNHTVIQLVSIRHFYTFPAGVRGLALHPVQYFALSSHPGRF